MASESFGPGSHTWDVPDGVSEITISLGGAEGGNGGDDETSTGEFNNGGFGGAGASTSASFNVSSGDTVDLTVGTTGNNGNDGDGLGGNGAGGDGGEPGGVIGESTGDEGDEGGGGGGGGGYTVAALNGSDVLAAGAGAGGNGAGDAGGEDGLNGGSGQATNESNSSYWGGEGGNIGDDRGPAPGGDSFYATSAFDVSQTAGGNSGDGAATISYTLPPDPPVNVSQTVDGDDQMTITWDQNSTGGDPDNYEIEVSEDGGSYVDVATVDGTTTSYVYSATQSVDTHRFRVRATNVEGASDWSYTVTKSTEITAVTLSNATADSVDASWDSVDGETEYDLLIAESSGSTETDYTVAATTTGTSATATGLTNGKQYFARAIARYPEADSLSTDEAAATTTLPATDFDTVEEL